MMRRTQTSILLVSFLLLLILLVAAPAVAVVVSFPDPGLEAAVRDAIVKPTGDIHDTDLLGLLFLFASNYGDYEPKISSLTGLEYCANLTVLQLDINGISDLSPLAELNSLMQLHLYLNEIVDVAPLSGLTNLQRLNLSWNEISNVIPLAGLTSLVNLDLAGNPITDINPLSELTNLLSLNLHGVPIADFSTVVRYARLTWLNLSHTQISELNILTGLIDLEEIYLSGNQIVDIATLSGLTNLTTVWLDRNGITDISALVNNAGIDSGDTVDVRWNHLNLTAGSDDMQDIQTLIDRGVDVEYAPQNVPPLSLVPVLLVHGYQYEGGFRPRELWKEMAEFLSGESIDNVQIVITGSNHLFWKLSASSEEKRTVYISRYSDDTSTPTCDDIRRYAQILSQEIEHIREVEATSKVDVVAHSMGGLVTRAYIEGEDFPRDLYSTQYEDDIRKFVMLGTPNHGCPSAALIEFFGLPLSPCKATEQMTPGSEFLNVLNYGCETCTSGNDLISDSVDYYVIAGNIGTCHPFDMGIGNPELCAMFGYDEHDRLVNVRSAELSGVDLTKYALDHSALRTADQPLKKVESLLREVPVLIDLAYSLTYACPISLLVTEGAGRQLSTLTGINEIPGATISISPTGDIVTLYLPLQFQYEITILGEGTGTFTLVERIPIDEQEALVYFFLDIPVTASTVAHISISVSQQGQRILRIDSDSDGVIDEERTAASYRIVDGEVVPEHGVTSSSEYVTHGPNPVPAEGCIFGSTCQMTLSAPLSRSSTSMVHYLSAFRLM